MSSATTSDLPRTGSPSRYGDLLGYSLHVSKDDRAAAQELNPFAQLLAQVIDQYYDGVDKALADAAGLSSSSISRYKTGQVPRPETIEKMAPFMHASLPKLMSLAYPRSVETGSDLGTTVHPLVMTLNQLIGEGTRMPAAERDALEAVVSTVLAPYRKYLRGPGRKAG